MLISKGGAKGKRDKQFYRCEECLTRESIRHNSFLLEITGSIEEFMKTIFYFFARNYDPELAHREMTENSSSDGVTTFTRMSKVGVHTMYVQARERISRYTAYSMAKKKFGGSG